MACLGDIVLADSAYGDSCEFREIVRMFGFDYAVGIHAPTTLWRLDSQDRRMGEPLTARAIADALPPRAFRTITWRDGTMPGKRGKLRSRFHFSRVKVAHDDGTNPASPRARVAHRRMARGRDGTEQVRAHDPATHDEQEADRPLCSRSATAPSASTRR